MSVFPKPLPLTHSTQVFPHFFTSNASLQLPFLPDDEGVAPVTEPLQLALQGVLCFQLIVNISQDSACMQLYNQTAAWLDRLLIVQPELMLLGSEELGLRAYPRAMLAFHPNHTGPHFAEAYETLCPRGLDVPRIIKHLQVIIGHIKAQHSEGLIILLMYGCYVG